MSGADDSIVGIRFDNADFERRVNDTIKSIENLQKSLDFSNSAKGMSDLSTAVSGFDASHIGVNIDSISSHFLALGSVAFSVLNNITTKAIDAGISIVKSLALDQVMAGYSEYELKLGSIQTIMAGSGASLAVVNSKLDELNTYADKTIYSFADMTTNIGKFTNAGVDLDTAVASIQGVANVAAVSGANAGEASRAMYNFAQALSKGYVQLIDWKSIELANMGTAEFKQQLIDSAEAAGKLTKRGEEWVTAEGTMVSATKGFNESLTDQWLTTEVLNKTLGDYADETTDIGKKAFAAAQDVKTFTQLVDTVKESIGSGWAQTFEILIGNFDEAKGLWTEVNNAVSGFVSASADHRNALLQGWKDLGGRDMLLSSITNATKAFGAVLTPIKNAFRDIFPQTTVVQLVTLTKHLENFTKKLIIGEGTATKIGNAFRGFFAVLDIGWEILKGVGGVLKSVFNSLSGVRSGVLDFASGTGDFLTSLHDSLVKGGAIEDFFANLAHWITIPLEKMKEFEQAFVDLFKKEGDTSAVENSVGRVTDRFGALIDRIQEFASKAKDILGTVWDFIKEWASNIGSAIGEAFSSGNFDTALDTLNVGLLGGIVLLLRKFLKGGLKLDFSGGLFDSIKGALGGLTDTLSNMQAQLKSKTLMNIAIAVGILAASITVLSLVDSGALTKALTAMSVGFGELMASMALLTSSKFGKATGKVMGIIGAMIGLAVAAAILAIAIKKLSGLDWNELATGLAGVAGGLALLVAATKLMTNDSAGLIKTGIAMIVISGAMWVLSAAVKSFAEMSWEEMAQGLLGVGVGLGILVLAVNLMPAGQMVSAGLGLVIMAGGLLILATAISSFSDVPFGDLLQGFAGIGVGLLVIAAGMHLMPSNMVASATGLLIVSGALYILAAAVKEMGSMDLGTLAKGIGAFFITLLILSAAMEAMTGAIGGAIALVVISGALMILVKVISIIGTMDIMTIVQGLVAIAAVFLVLGVAAALLTPTIPALLGLAAALALLGVAFVLFGAGVWLVAKGFEALGNMAESSVNNLINIIKRLVAMIPEILTTLASALIDAGVTLLSSADKLIDPLMALLTKLLDAIIKLAPKVAEALVAIVKEALGALRAIFPDVVATILELVYSIVAGIRDNIDRIVTAVVELLTAFINALANNAGMLVGAGLNLISSLIQGITDNIWMITEAVANLIVAFITALADAYLTIIDAGFQLLVTFLLGITDNIMLVVDTVTDIITTFITGLGGAALQIIDAGFAMLTALLQGIGDHITDVVTTVGTIVTTFITEVGAQATNIAAAGAKALVDFLGGIEEDGKAVMDKGVDVVINLLSAMASDAVDFVNRAAAVLLAFLNGLTQAIKNNSEPINNAAADLAEAIIDGVVKGIGTFGGRIMEKLGSIATGAIDFMMDKVGASSPSKEFAKIGGYMMQGLVVGMDDHEQAVYKSIGDIADGTIQTFQDSLNKVQFDLAEVQDTNPVITPVLDLTKVKATAAGIQDYMNVTPITAAVSYEKARTISTTAEAVGRDTETPTPPSPQEITFNQNIYAPEALSTNDIYRNTKSQIAMAKEELNIA